MGWAQTRRDLGGLIFIDLRDREGITQVVMNPQEAPGAATAAAQVRSEYVIAVRGIVAERPAGTVNPKLPTGDIEVRIRELRILNPAETPPFRIADDVAVDEAVRLRYRYLDLRRPSMYGRLALRHRLTKAVRDHLSREGFLEVETPMLIKSTPEGARDFLVPSRLHPGKFYVLPQSPQLFKQLLMVAGVERYFQIARCFRDEDGRADRQPEFTQIDIEMSFVDIDDVIQLTEGMVAAAVRDALGIEVPIPFPRLTYAEAMARYGTDKPDIRFGLQIVDCSDLARDSGFQVFTKALESGGTVRGVCVPGAGGLSRREVEQLEEDARAAGARGLIPIHVDQAGARGAAVRHLGPGSLAALETRLQGKPGDLLLFVADAPAVASAALGRLRLDLGRRLGLVPDRLAFLWVLMFPLFERDQRGDRLVAMHHPFTAPVDEDLHLLGADPLAVRAKAYDLVLNGVELGGGSIRIHRQELQARMFDLLGITPEEARDRFGFLLDAFQYGAPPHGGIALGLDRAVMVLAGQETIREVIAFPKTQSAADLMTGAPSAVDPAATDEAHIQLKLPRA
jgi:aspartyl-tRNA synthetase